MAKTWIPVEPLDRESRGTLEYYLREVQRFLLTPAENEKLHLWVRKYLQNRPAAQLIPRMVFEESYRLLQKEAPELLNNPQKLEVSPLKNRFIMPLREGWVQRRERKRRMTWEEFNFGLSTSVANPEDNRIVTPNRAEIELFEEESMRWRWGGLRLRGKFYERLQNQFESLGYEWNNGQGFFRNVRYIEVRKVITTKKSAGVEGEEMEELGEVEADVEEVSEAETVERWKIYFVPNA